MWRLKGNPTDGTVAGSQVWAVLPGGEWWRENKRQNPLGTQDGLWLHCRLSENWIKDMKEVRPQSIAKEITSELQFTKLQSWSRTLMTKYSKATVWPPCITKCPEEINSLWIGSMERAVLAAFNREWILSPWTWFFHRNKSCFLTWTWTFSVNLDHY